MDPDLQKIVDDLTEVVDQMSNMYAKALRRAFVLAVTHFDARLTKLEEKFETLDTQVNPLLGWLDG